MKNDDIEKKEYSGKYRIRICEKKGILTKFTVYNNQSSWFNLFWLSINIILACGFFLKSNTLNIVVILSDTFKFVSFVVLLAAVNLILLQFNGSIIKKESLVITKNVGVLIEKKMLSGKKEKQFICVHNIRDLLINEGLTPYDVRYYLAIIAKEQDQLILLFSSFQLRLADLLKIYYPARQEIQNDIHKK